MADPLPEHDLLRDCRTVLRDLSFGWHSDDLHRTVREVCDEISQLLDDGYDFETGNDDEVGHE